MFAFACYFLWDNEAKYVKAQAVLRKLVGDAVSLGSLRDAKPVKEGSIVCASGRASAEKFSDALQDDNPDLAAAGLAPRASPEALRLKRTVQFFQWREKSETSTEKKVGGSQTKTTTYTHTKEWCDHPIDSSKFKGRCPGTNPTFPLPHEMEWFAPVKLEDSGSTLTLSQDVVKKVDSWQSLGKTRMINGRFKETDANADVGDMKISHKEVQPVGVTVLARLCSVSAYADNSALDANETLPVKPPFKLKVNIKSVKHLPQMDTFGKCDGFVVMQCGDGVNQQIKNTATKSNEYDPVFNENFEFKVTDSSHSLNVKVMDANTLCSHKEVGAYEMQLGNLKVGTVDHELTITKDQKVVIGSDKEKTTISMSVTVQPMAPIRPRLEPISIDGVDMTRAEIGTLSLSQMAKRIANDQWLDTWFRRLGGWIIMWIGMVMMCKPLIRLLDIIPFIGNLFEKGVFFITFLASFSLSVSIISGSWLKHRPLMTVGMLAGTAAFAFVISQIL